MTFSKYFTNQVHFVELVLELSRETAGQTYLGSERSHQYVISAFFDFPDLKNIFFRPMVRSQSYKRKKVEINPTFFDGALSQFRS